MLSTPKYILINTFVNFIKWLEKCLPKHESEAKPELRLTYDKNCLIQGKSVCVCVYVDTLHPVVMADLEYISTKAGITRNTLFFIRLKIC